MKNTFNGFVPIYVINLKNREDRKKHIDSEFKKHSIKKYIFFEAVDGNDESIKDLLISKDTKLSNKELACTMSHLLAIKKWLDTDSSEYAIIMEDDLSFDTVKYWPFTWKEFLGSIKHNYDMLQLCIVNIRKINTSFHLREIHDTSAACYLIKRDRAKALIEKHIVDGKFNIPASRYYSVADTLVYAGALCYSFPLFTDSPDMESDISKDRDVNTDAIHVKSKKEVLAFWETRPAGIYKKIGGRFING